MRRSSANRATRQLATHHNDIDNDRDRGQSHRQKEHPPKTHPLKNTHQNCSEEGDAEKLHSRLRAQMLHALVVEPERHGKPGEKWGMGAHYHNGSCSTFPRTCKMAEPEHHGKPGDGWGRKDVVDGWTKILHWGWANNRIEPPSERFKLKESYW